MLRNREEAAQLLLKKLASYKNQNPLVLGIPRGGMPMAKIIAEGLRGELNAILIHKIPAPYQKDLAVGAVGLSGRIFRLPVVEVYEISDSYMEREARRQLQSLKTKKEKYQLQEAGCRDRVVIIVDDGVATGATVIGAIQEVRAQNPEKIVLAVGVIASTAAAGIRNLVDELLVLEEPEGFFEIGQHYSDFPEITEEDVGRLLNSYRSRASSPDTLFY